MEQLGLSFSFMVDQSSLRALDILSGRVWDLLGCLDSHL